jgi:sugar O-acyltransferase (sialic acid O-acetyltransferase NeuD family)
MIKRKVLIFPFNGNGIEALECLDVDKYEFVGFIDDDPEKKSEKFAVFPRSILFKDQELGILAVPGSPLTFRDRADIIRSLSVSINRFITAIHPTASIGASVKIGYNCVIMAGVVITSNAVLNNHVCVLPNTVIHHDVVIEDYVMIGSNVVVAGNTTIRQGCYIGSGSNIINGVQLGEQSLLGLGSNLTKSIEPNSKVAGNPAKTIGLHQSIDHGEKN